MKKETDAYVCQTCGISYPKWRGKCDGCSQWNTLVLEKSAPTEAKSSVALQTKAVSHLLLNQSSKESFQRLTSGIKEFDRVCGGGLVESAVVLVTGDPGIGKSTLLLQIAAQISQSRQVFYVSGEESATQIQLRARRLGLEQSLVHLITHNVLDDILETVSSILVAQKDEPLPKAFIIMDSIQTLLCRSTGGGAGSLSQIRESMQQLITFAKSTGIPVVIVGHITKDGLIAGPKVLEHMVDTVLYFEGEKTHIYRLLRTIKNRFGPTDEIGVFDMTEKGLREVPNPSAFFLSHRKKEISGACVFAGIEGTRPLLMEIQVLATPSFLASPRRSVVGWDNNRLSMVLAVLETRYKMQFSNKDVFLSILGGLKVSEPAADLSVALALVSFIKKKPLPAKSIAFGEMGLTGEITPVSYTDQRLKEAEKLGFSHVFMPCHQKKFSTSLQISAINHVQDLDLLFH